MEIAHLLGMQQNNIQEFMMYLLRPLFKRFAVGLLAISLSAVAGISEATPLYGQAPVDPIDGFEADSSSPLLADDFNIDHHVSLEGITWWGTYLDENTDKFVVKLYTDLAGAGTSLEYLTIDRSSLTDSAGSEYYRYHFDLSKPKDLSAGNYYLSIQNQGLSSWVWLTSLPGNGSSWNLPDSAQNWSETNPQGDLAFELEGTVSTVPEPDTLMLMLLAGSLLLMSRKLGNV